MAYRDYYNILGVKRTASQDEIKRAYRNLARRWHPDRAPDDEAATQRFKDITEAYETLGDPDRRARYDRLGPLYTPDGRPPRPDELNETVGAVFGNLFRRRKSEAGGDLRYTISITLEEVATGVDKKIVVPHQVRCKTCGGDGAAPDGGRQTCTVCGGSGRASGPRLFRTDCYHCEGRGFEVVVPCERCSGNGTYLVDDELTVHVPAGVATGQKLKLKGKGNVPRGSGEAGDLFVIVNVAEHDLFRRRGDDVVCEIPLTFAEVALGADVTVPTLEGTTTIRIPAGTKPGRIFRLGGRGVPRVGRAGSRGDLHLHVVLEVPNDLDAKQSKALANWASHLPPGAHPRRASFDAALRDR